MSGHKNVNLKTVLNHSYIVKVEQLAQPSLGSLGLQDKPGASETLLKVT